MADSNFNTKPDINNKPDIFDLKYVSEMAKNHARLSGNISPIGIDYGGLQLEQYRGLYNGLDEFEGIKYEELSDAGEWRGQVQTTGDKWANALTKMGITAGTTFLDGTLGTVWGLIELAAGGSFINNKFSNAMADISEWQEKVLPNYYTKEELDNPWYSNLGTANFWADKIVKNIGFAVGAMYSGAAWAGAARGLLGTTKIANRVGKGLADKMFKGTADDYLKGIKSGQISGETLLPELARDAKLLSRHNVAQQWIGSATGAMGESRIESISNAREFEENKLAEFENKYSDINYLNQLKIEANSQGLFDENDINNYIETKKNDELATIKGAVDSYRNANFFMDMAVLTASNWLQFKNAYGGGYNNIKIANNLVKKAGGKGEVEVAKKGILPSVAGYFKDGFIEGHEELMQRVTKETGDEFYAQKLNPQGDKAMKGYMEMLLGQYTEHITNPDKWEDFIIGAFIGMMGTPSFGTGRMWSGGVVEKYFENKQEQTYATEIATNWNEFVNSDRYKDVVRSFGYEHAKTRYLEEGDTFNYKNAENGQFTSDVLTALKADKFEDLLEVFEGMPNAGTAEEIKEMLVPSRDEKGNEIPIEKRESTLKNKTPEEIDSYIRERSRNLIAKAKEIREIADQVELKFGNIPQSVKETLIYYASNIKDTEARAKEINSELTKASPGVSVLLDNIKAKLNENEGKITKELSEEIKNTKEFLEGVEKKNPGTELVEKFNDLIKLEQRRTDFVNLYVNSVTQEGLQKIKDTQDEFDAESEKVTNTIESEKNYKDGDNIYDRVTGNLVGKLVKVDGKWRLQKTNVRGTTWTENVDITSKKFLDKYTSDYNNIEESGFKEFIDKKSGAIVKVGKDSEGKLNIVNAKGEFIRVLTEKELNAEFLPNDGGDTYSFRSKKSGRYFDVGKTKDGRYYIIVPKKIAKAKAKYVELTEKQLRDNYDYKLTWENYKTKYLKTTAINRIVEKLENALKDVSNLLIGEETDLNNIKEAIDSLSKDIVKLQENKSYGYKKLSKLLNDNIDNLMDELVKKEKYVKELESRLDKLKVEKEKYDLHFKNRRESIESGLDNNYLKNRKQELEKDIAFTEQRINNFKTLIREIKDFLNSIFEALNLKHFNTKHNIRVPGIIGIEDLKGTAKIIKESLKKLNYEEISKNYLKDLNSKLDKLVEKNELAKAELELINLELAQVKQIQREEALAKINVRKEFLNPPVKGEALPVETDASNLSDEAIMESYFGRNLDVGITGLIGKHYTDDSDQVQNEDPRARGFYMFTSNKDQSELSKYKVKIELDPETDAKLKDEGANYDAKPDENDRVTLAAYVVDKDGNYVDADGKATTDKSIAIRAFIPISETMVNKTNDVTSTHFRKPDGMSDNVFLKKLDDLKAELSTVRGTIIRKLNSGEEVKLSIKGKSPGIPRSTKIHDGQMELKPITKAFGHNDVSIQVVTAPSSQVMGGQIAGKPGRVYVKDKKTGNVFSVKPRKANSKEATMLAKLFMNFVDNQFKNKEAFLQTKDENGNLIPVKLDNKPVSVFDVLEKLTFWTGDNLTAEAVELIKADKLTKEQAYKDEKYLINKKVNGERAFYFKPSINGKNYDVVLGGDGKMANIISMIVKDETTGREIINPILEQKLTEFFQGQFINISAKTANHNSGFIAITDINQDENGNYYITKEKKYEKSNGYSQWLLDNEVLQTDIIDKGQLDNAGNEAPQVTSSYLMVNYDSVRESNRKEDKVQPNTSTEKFESGFRAVTDEVEEFEANQASLDKENNEPEDLGFGQENNTEAKKADIELARELYKEMKKGKRLTDFIGKERTILYNPNIFTQELRDSVDAEIDALEAQTNVTQQEQPTIKQEVDNVDNNDLKDLKDEFDSEDNNIPFKLPTLEKEPIKVQQAIVEIDRMFGGRVRSSIVKNLVAGKAWGSYRDKLITLYEKAGIGTEYHEAFHAVLDLFMTNREVRRLFNEYRIKNGEPNLTDKEVEERIADDFQDFMLGKEIKYFKTPKQRTLFQTIMDFINKMLGRDLESVFNKLSQGYYANKPFVTKSGDRGITNHKAAIKGLNAQETAEFLDSMNALFFRHIFSTEGNINSLFDKDSNAELIKNAYTDTYKMLKVGGKRLINLYETTKNVEYFNRAKKVKISLDNFADLVALHKQQLAKYNLEFTQDELTDSLNEVERGRDSMQTWAFESMKYSTKLNANKNVKLLVASLPAVQEDGTTPEYNQYELPVSLDYGRTFNILINKTANLTSYTDMYEALDRMSLTEPWVKVLLRRLGGNDIDGLSTSQLQLRSQFHQSMAKNDNSYMMDIFFKDGVQVINSNQNTFAKRKVVEWKNNMIKKARSGNNHYITLKNGKIFFKTEAIKALNTGRFRSQDFINFFKTIGIEFNNPLELVDFEGFYEKANNTVAGLGKWTEVFDITESDNPLIMDLGKLALMEKETTNDAVENSLFNIEGEMIQSNVLNSYLDLIKNAINNKKVKSLQDLYEVLPHLKYVKNSLFLEKLFENNVKNSIKIDIHEGSKQSEFDSKSFDDLKPGDRLRVWYLNAMYHNRFALLRPADNSIERFIDFGNIFDDIDIPSGDYREVILNYLIAEIEESHDLSKLNIKNVSNNLGHGIVLDIIKKYDVGLYNDLFKFIENKEGLDKHIMDRKGIIEEIIKQYFNDQAEILFNLSEENQLVVKTKEGEHKSYMGEKAVTGATETIKAEIRQFAIKNFIGLNEQVKLFVGNPIMYKSVEDEFKRHSGMVGTKKISIVDTYMNNFIDNNTDKLSNLKQQYSEGKPIIRTIVTEDVKAISSFLNIYKKLLGYKANAYENMDEGDAFGLIHLDEYRRMLQRSGDWTYGKGSLEEAYQYHKGLKEYTDTVSGEKFEFDKKRISKVTFNPLKPQYFGAMANIDAFVQTFYKLSLTPILPNMTKEFPVLKQLNDQMELQGAGIFVFGSGNKVGTKLDENGKFQTVYDENGKFAFNKDNLAVTQDTYYQYWGIQVDMGNKAKNKVVWGTQMAKQVINNLYEAGVPKAMRFWQNGKLSNKSEENTRKVIEKYYELNGKRIELGFTSLLDKLGLEVTVKDLGDGATENIYKVKDSAKFINTLKEEAISRELPDNMIESIDYIIENGIDAQPNRKKLEQILMSIADKSVISQKKFGKASVQNASTFLEKGIRKVIKKGKKGKEKIFYASNELKCYDVKYDKYEEDGVTPTKDAEIISVSSMEVYLPAIFKDKVDINNVDKRLLKLIGFRIPTQGLNSIESIVIKGFLPEEAGDMIVLPTEIVAKSGSDFDIDKLNIFIPNFYQILGNPKYIDSELDYKTYLEDKEKDLTNNLRNVFLNKVKDRLNYYQSTASVQSVSEAMTLKVIENFSKFIFGKLKTIESRSEIIEEVTKHINTESFKRISSNNPLIKEVVEELVKDLTSAEKSIEILEDSLLSENEFKKLQIENEIMEVLDMIVTSPDNAYQLLNPNSADMLKEEADYIEYLNFKRDGIYNGTKEGFKKWFKSYKAKTPYNSIVEVPFLLDLSKRYLGGNAAVGITALVSTFHILSQQNGVTVANNYINKNSKHVSTDIKLPHNKVGEEISLGNTKNIKGESIVELLSAWINAAVDAAKDPFMFTLNATPQTLNTVLYLTMAGVPKKTVALFMNQPIIRKYMELQNKYETVFADHYGLSEKKEKVLKLTKDMFKDENLTEELTDEILEQELLRGDKGKYQITILDDFIRYQDTAKFVSDAMRAVNYDTKSGGKSVMEMLYRVKATKSTIEAGVIKGVDRILNEGFVKPYYEAVTEFSDVFKPYIPMLDNPQIKNLFENFMDRYLQLEFNIPDTRVVDVSEKIRDHFLNYVLLTQGKNPIINEYNRLMLSSPTSMANRIAQAEEKFPDNMLLQNLLPIFAENTKVAKGVDETNTEAIDNIKMYMTKLDAIESNAITEDWDNLLALDPELANDLMKFIIIQSGVQNSPMNFINLIPTKSLNEIVKKSFENLKLTSSQENEFLNLFAFHNQWDKDIVPRKRVKMFNIYRKYIYNQGIIVDNQLRFADSNEAVKVINPPIVDYKNNRTALGYGRTKLVTSEKDDVIMPFERYELLEDYSQSTGQTLGTETKSTQPTSTEQTDNRSKKQDIFNIKTNNGITISSLGYTQEQWNSFSKEKQEKIKNCN